MEYSGKLYGKIGRRYVPLKQTSEDVDKLERDNADLLEALETLVNMPDDRNLCDFSQSELQAWEKAVAAINKAKGGNQ